MRFVFEIEPYEVGWIWDRLTEKAVAWAKEQEMEDDDAEDESCDCDDESCSETAEEAVAETVKFFVDHQEVWEALSGLVNAMRDAGVSGTISLDRSDEPRKTDRR